MRKYLFLITLISLATFNTFGQSKIKAIKVGKLIDVISGTVLKNQIILINNNLITEIGNNITIPKDAEIIDLSNSTVLPGLIDCHTHITSEPSDDYYADIFRKTDMDYAVRAPTYAKRTLAAGFTTCRDLGSANLLDISLRDAINE